VVSIDDEHRGGAREAISDWALSSSSIDLSSIRDCSNNRDATINDSILIEHPSIESGSRNQEMRIALRMHLRAMTESGGLSIIELASSIQSRQASGARLLTSIIRLMVSIKSMCRLRL